MIVGVGCDICDCRRIEKLINKYPIRFLSKVFTSHEVSRMQKRKGNAVILGYAKIFAAKEAVVKALGGSFGASWQDIEIKRDIDCPPRVCLYGPAKARAESISGGNYQFFLSLSDEPPYAMAYVLLQKAG